MIEKVNLKKQVDTLSNLFEYKRIGTFNNHMMNVLQAENRTLEFHTHNSSDEMFYCIEGEFDIEFEDGITHLCEGVIKQFREMFPDIKFIVESMY